MHDLDVSGELALWWTVLERAILDRVAPTVDSRDKLGRIGERELAKWFFDWTEEDVATHCSLPWICDILGIDPVAVEMVVRRAEAGLLEITGPTNSIVARCLPNILIDRPTATQLEVYDQYTDGRTPQEFARNRKRRAH